MIVPMTTKRALLFVIFPLAALPAQVHWV